MSEITPAKWKQRIERSIRYSDKKKKEAARFQRGYTGDYNEHPAKGLEDNKDEAVVNFIFSFVETIGPNIFSGMPRIFLEAMDHESELGTHYLQGLVNYWFKRLGVRNKLYRCRFDYFFSHAAFLTEWDYQEKLVEVEKIMHVNPMTGEPVMGTAQEMRPIVDRPLLRRIDPWDVLLDTDSRDRDDDRWRGMKMLMTKTEFDALPSVGSKMKEEIQGRSIPREMVAQPMDGEKENGDSDNEWVVLYKIYDLENETVKLLPYQDDSASDFVELKPWPFDFEVEGDRFPITILEACHDPTNPYGFSPFKAYWSQIQEKNRFRTMLQSHTRRHSPGWLAKKNALDEEQKAKFIKAKIGEYIEANNPEGVIAKPMPEFPADSFAYNTILSDDLRDVSGFAEERNDSLANTATEASILEGRSTQRKGEKKDHFMNFVAKIGGKTAGLCQQFQTIEQAIKIKHPTDPRQMAWKNVSREDIQGEYLYTAKPGVTEQQDESLFRQQSLKAAEVLANNKHADQRKVAIMIASAFGKEEDEILRPAQEVAAEEQAMMAAEQEKNHEPDIQFDKVKWETLPPEIQAKVLHAAMQQNGVKDDGTLHGGLDQTLSPEASQPGTPGSGTTLGDGGDANDGAMPGADINQAPPALPGANMPPMNPVLPISESQGG